MKTRKQIIEEYASKGYTIGTFDDIKDSINYVDQNTLIFISKDNNGFFLEDVCPRYEGDFESVDFDEYKKYIKTKKWKTIAKEVKERANNKCEICGSERKLVTHHHNYVNVYNETHDDLLCVCNRCHETIHHGCSCFKSAELCKPCSYSKEHYQILYNFLKRTYV